MKEQLASLHYCFYDYRWQWTLLLQNDLDCLQKNIQFPGPHWGDKGVGDCLHLYFGKLVRGFWSIPRLEPSGLFPFHTQNTESKASHPDYRESYFPAQGFCKAADWLTLPWKADTSWSVSQISDSQSRNKKYSQWFHMQSHSLFFFKCIDFFIYI